MAVIRPAFNWVRARRKSFTVDLALLHFPGKPFVHIYLLYYNWIDITMTVFFSLLFFVYFRLSKVNRSVLHEGIQFPTTIKLTLDVSFIASDA